MPRKKAATGPTPFTVPVPEPLPAERDGEHWWIERDGRRVRLSNLDKVFWPDEGYTKGDLLAYYYNVSELLLPYLADRPLTMKRMPNGITGDFFYEKNAPQGTPDWMRRCPVESSDAKNKVIEYLMVDDLLGLLFMVNLGCIEFHPLHARCDTYDYPDYAFFDLDPFEVPFEDVLAVARHVKAALDVLRVRCYPKTSGATGMQIYAPIEPKFTHDEVREFVRLIGLMIKQADPKRVTMQWEVRSRTGKVFIDHNMNRSGANISAVYSMRPEPGATLSTPVTWEEVERGISPQDFRIDTIWERLERVGDLFRPVISEPQDLRPAMEAVGVDVAAAPPMPGVIQGGRARSRGSSKQEAEGDPPGRSRRSRSQEAIARSKDPKLGQYLSMRDFGATPEPAGGEPSPAGDSFVIQKHNATRLHYDLRLERDGVLVSWAVPKGLPTTPGDKRLAVHTEDHPLEYGSFEGWIPEGHYGAGEVKIFDAGTYEPIEWTDDKVSFRLHGTRLQGEWHLVKTRRGENDWLVFLSKRSTVEQPGRAPDFQPMLADAAPEPFDDPAWRFEPKMDGVRTLAYVSTEATRLVSRRGRDQTATYPELRRLAENVNALSAVLDGEIVAVDEAGRPSFERLQQRMNLASERDVERARRQIPVGLFVFDLLWVDGQDLTSRPLTERRERLEGIVTSAEPLLLTTYVDGEGVSFYKACKDLGFEGIMAKRLASRYQSGKRSPDWKKIKIKNRQDCVILGWTPGEGKRRDGFGALLLGAFSRGRLRWVGQVGTGFTDQGVRDLLATLRDLEVDHPPIEDRELARAKGAHWVEPRLVCEVEYAEQTKAGKLRAPSFKGLRQDKLPEDCVLEPPAPV